MTNRALFILPIMIAGLVGCTTTALAQAQDAILVNASSETRAEITQLISKALNGRSVTIAPNSFTKDSRLIIEQRPSFGPNGYRADGRDIPKPDHFYLRSAGGKCYVFHAQSEKAYPLSSAECRPA